MMHHNPKQVEEKEKKKKSAANLLPVQVIMIERRGMYMSRTNREVSTKNSVYVGV
jgi:hypothetical protein